ncbi:MAG: TMEM175 family protein [Nocardioidaceae bacterium]|nr:TMEM175 family protein [Nocardioidaceae bacterium]MCL2614172.1 TMEM175 family protein [Nocardioidaceae bacterium]
MRSGRLEAFSDGVLAIVITIMVLGLRAPRGVGWHALFDTSGLGLVTYLVSFVYVGIYWNNHHHLFQLVDHADGAVLWANLHLLFWLSLFPFSTSWLDHSRLAQVPTIVYGANLLAAAIAYFLLQRAIMRTPSGDRARAALGVDLKGKVSPVVYVAGILAALWVPWVGLVPPVVVALMWLVPDRRVEKFLAEERELLGRDE